jgi:hypothetical protein
VQAYTDAFQLYAAQEQALKVTEIGECLKGATRVHPCCIPGVILSNRMSPLLRFSAEITCAACRMVLRLVRFAYVRSRGCLGSCNGPFFSCIYSASG